MTRFVIALCASLACFCGLSRACDGYGCAVQVQQAPLTYAQPAVFQQSFSVPLQVQFAVQAAPVLVQQAPVYQAPAVSFAPAFAPSYAYGYGVQRSFAPSYGFSAQRSFVGGYGASFGVQRSSIVGRSAVVSSAVVAGPAVVQQSVVERRGLFGRRNVTRSVTVVR